ncbi:MAG: glycosyltransferase family 39 protein, partial [Anaerolineae bacterium]|nr:glycosyltransferase family 39 protein [Anaerolineae bacterium]
MSGDESTSLNRIGHTVLLAGLLALGGWLRLRFINTVHLYPDEFATLFAVQMIREKGLPVMPSGLFYEHGLLFSYAGSLAALFGPPPQTVRYASLLFGLATLGLTYAVGRRWFSPAVGLIATAGLALAPTAVHWSGRARMYALLQLLLLLTLWLAYEGLRRDQARLRWAALLAYLGAMLTHFVSVTLAPPLVLVALVSFWQRRAGEQGSGGAGENSPPHP